MSTTCDVAIIGAGPYGLSLAAHLRAAGISFRIFGKPMSTWRDHMPRGMFLKSEAFASNLSAPDSVSSLKFWCKTTGTDYSPQHAPVALETFLGYADWFTRTHAANLDQRTVTQLTKQGDGFLLSLDGGGTVVAKRVVLAVGIGAFRHIPAEFAALSARHVSHSFDHHDCRRFQGRDVTVIGAGASAVDTAIALHDAGANVNLIARRSTIAFHTPPDNAPPSVLRQLQTPDTGIGPGWRSFFCVNAPLIFHRLPQSLRLEITRRHLGPAPGWFTREKFEGRIETRLGCEVRHAAIAGGRVALTLGDHEDNERIVTTDHVVSATGFRADLERLSFLDNGLRESIAQVERTPILSDNFETSVPDLYVLGLLAANSFGPLLRFMCGTEFAAPRLARHLDRRIRKSDSRRAA